ncbi:MAG: alpha-L-fucosidase, partial [Kiritimatiellae bacterium]|nr:alpha-L-fucosidase [Kiritimatiellia bacterium]
EKFGAGGESIDYSKENEGRDMAKYRQFMKNQVTELLTNYGKIDIIWFDFSFPGKNGKNRYDWDSEGLVRLAKKLQPEIIIDNRLDLTDWEDGWDFATPEQSRPAGCVEVHGRKVPWETCQTFSGSWGYARDESSWKSAYQCIEQLIDAVSKGGNVIMNVGPMATGEFDYRAIERLADYGKWLRVNGDSIYGCGPAPEEFTPIPGTTLTYNPKTNRLYMHMLSWRFGTFQIPFGERVKCCRLLNDGSELRFRWNTLHLPVEKPPVEIPVVEFILK